jgi:hypothetical protein
MLEYDVNEIKSILAKAKTAAANASQEYFTEKMNSEDNYPCGFAWVNIYGIKGNTKLGRAMKAAGIEKDYSGAYKIWNPGEMFVQNVDIKEAGAEAAADVFESFGFKAYANSRLD